MQAYVAKMMAQIRATMSGILCIKLTQVKEQTCIIGKEADARQS